MNAENKITVDEKVTENVFIGTDISNEKITSLAEKIFATRDICLLGFDGNYCVEWQAILGALGKCAAAKGIKLRTIHINRVLDYTVKQVKIFMPGAWGAYRFKQLLDVPGLSTAL